MKKYVLNFNEIDKTYLPYVGGKGANLGEMTKAGFPVPGGFCVTTWAYKTFVHNSVRMNDFFDQLDNVNPDDLEQIRVLGKNMREHIASIAMPEDIKAAVVEAWETAGRDKAYAVRSSATAEDLPTASFAGQQDTYLNILGESQLLKAVQDCWASLFTDRAITYRAKNNFDHRSVFLSVVVQQMVFPEVSGIMFTADPITGHRQTVSVDASFGLGEALVSGLVTADLYQVRAGKVIRKKISKKKIAIYSVPEGGTVTKDIPVEKQEVQALVDSRIIELAQLGQKIEAHYGSEQDIEWGLANDKFYILQSRPITSLYPIPSVPDDKFRIFLSFGHIQMMTDAMKPMAISFFSNIANFLKEDPSSTVSFFTHTAGGRLFADITGPLKLKPARHMLLKVFRSMDELMASAVAEAITRAEFKKLSLPKSSVLRIVHKMAPVIIPAVIKVQRNLHVNDPREAIDHVNRLIEMIVKENERYIFEAAGAERIRRIRNSMGNMLPKVISKVVVYWITGVLASGELKKQLIDQVGETQAAYLLSQLNKSLPGNVTSELGLELGDLADKARNYPEVMEYLENAEENGFNESLLRVRGGSEFKKALDSFLAKYGMRCSGEIDITKPRWREEPTQIIPSIISNIRTLKPGEHRERFKQGKAEAEQAEKEIIAGFSSSKKKKISRLVMLYRNLMGLREHHKFAVILLFDIFKRAILEEAEALVQKGALKDEGDVFYITLEELIALEESSFQGNAHELIEARKNQLEFSQKLTVPRVMTSEGEVINGKRENANVPEGALAGTGVSAGVVEGIARVITRLEDAKLNPGEILVAPYTDPAWTPLFTSAIGLIIEVGGMMSHGSVIAREYGIPAVAGIDNATEIIRDGARIRVNGTEGYVQIVSED